MLISKSKIFGNVKVGYNYNDKGLIEIIFAANYILFDFKLYIALYLY